MFISLAVSAQDFVTRFLDKREPDAHLICVSVSPKMMQEVLKIDVVEENNDLLDIEFKKYANADIRGRRCEVF